MNQQPLLPQPQIRLARAEDRAAVFAFTAQTWDDGDYIAYVWDDWLHDPSGTLLVADLAGKPVGLARLTLLAHDEFWFEALRVAPDQRGRGLGALLFQHCVERAHSSGGRVLRLLTSDDNRPMHLLAERLGFRLSLRACWYAAPTRPGDRRAVPVRRDQAPALLAQINSGPLLRQAGGLYAADWRYYELTAARLTAYLERGAALATPDGSAGALLIADADEALITALWGEGNALTELLADLRASPNRTAQPGQPPLVRVLLTDPPLPGVDLAAAGYAAEVMMRCYELRF